MVAAIIGALIGALVTGVGLYYRISEKDDSESCKIYGTISAVNPLTNPATAEIS